MLSVSQICKYFTELQCKEINTHDQAYNSTPIIDRKDRYLYKCVTFTFFYDPVFVRNTLDQTHT
jgi:hypothetical protein